MIKYYTTSYPMVIETFIQIEVRERENYDLEEINNWIRKYNITPDTRMVWVTKKPHIAASYLMCAGDRLYAEEKYNNNKSMYDEEIDIYNESEGRILSESDDGDEGFLLILN